MSDELREYVMGSLDSDKISLITMEGGAAVDMFDRALKKVMANIADENTTMKAREINLKVKVTPSDTGRNVVSVDISVPPPKLCGQENITGLADVAVDAGGYGPYAKHRPNRQRDLFSNIHPMRSKQGE